MPSVSSSKAKDADAAVVEDKAQDQADVDAAFKETVTRAITKINQKEVPEKPTLDDQNKTFRTRLVAVWMLSNATLAIAIENINGVPNPNATVDQENLQHKEHIYFTFILYSTFGLSLFRFIGVSPNVFCISNLDANMMAATVSLLLCQTESFQMFPQKLITFSASVDSCIKTLLSGQLLLLSIGPFLLLYSSSKSSSPSEETPTIFSHNVTHSSYFFTSPRYRK